MIDFLKSSFFKMVVFIKLVVSLTIVNDDPSLTIVNDDPSLTIINDEPSLRIVNIIVNKFFFKNDRLFKNNRIKNGRKSVF